MRLWSLHPKYLDQKGLIALWREGLLAKAVLESKTKGYRNHPQLNRFKEVEDPISAINEYLSHVYFESVRRNYKFDKAKIEFTHFGNNILVSSRQLQLEAKILNGKLLKRGQNYQIENPINHPCVTIFSGPVAEWEKYEDD
jgi:hypothetical protein